MSYTGTILTVDLTEKKIERTHTSEYSKDYIGGYGIATKIIWDEVPPEASGTDPENVLTINPGPLTGTLFGNKCNIMVKSPLYTNKTMATAGMGGQFPSELKFAGYDNLVIKGKSDEPVYLFIDNDRVEIRDATHLWGLDVHETQMRLKSELKDPEIQIAAIGPAGENLIAFSMVVHDIQNTASKGGFGAVMGSKNLKAVAVRGTKGLKVADPDAFKKLWEEYYNWYYNGRGRMMMHALNKEGQAYHADKHYVSRDMMVWGYFDSFIVPRTEKEETQGDWVMKYVTSNLGCAFCPFQCAHNLDVPGLGAVGLNCQNYTGFRQHTKTTDLKVWYKATRLCQMYGVDNMTMAGITSFLMKLYELGIVTAADTDGVPMEWGSEKAAMTCIEKVCRQEGFGKLFVDGIVPAARSIGKDALDYAVQTRNINPFPGGAPLKASVGVWYMVPSSQEIWMHPPSVDKDGVWPMIKEYYGMSEEEAERTVEEWASDNAERYTGDRDAWREDNYEKCADYAVHMENAIAACDITGHCDYPSDRGQHCGNKWGPEEAARAISATTGESCSTERLLDAIQRRRLLELSYHHLCYRALGEEDVSPMIMIEKFLNRDGFYKGEVPDLEKLPLVTERYYTLRGCDPDTEIPTRKDLNDIGLMDAAERLESAGFELTDSLDDV